MKHGMNAQQSELTSNRTPIKLDPSMPAQLLVVIDTEEEFDWGAAPDSNARAVTAMDQIGLAQDIFDEYSIQPCYVVDDPVVSDQRGYSELLKIYRDQRCEIGAHLHPWVTAPLEEELCLKNTFPGNLPKDLEKRKLANLSKKIESVFGESPTIYKAGRYGIGPNTTEVLDELGYKIDLSVCPPFDMRDYFGPDFSDCHAEPFWFGKDQNMLEIPLTGAYTGWAGRFRKPAHQLGEKFRSLKLSSIFSRLHFVDRLRLSPEGFSSIEHIRLTRFLYASGVRTFTWTFHSPSLVPGHTSYVQNQQELRDFLAAFRRYFDFFFNTLGGVATTPTTLLKKLEAQGNAG